MAQVELPISRIIIETPNKDVLVVRRKSGRFAGKWELPGGRVNAQEDPLAGLVREVKEEVGIDLNHGKIDFLFTTGVIDSRKHVPLIGDPPIISQQVYSTKVADPIEIILGNEHNRYKMLSASLFDENNSPDKFTDLTRSSLSWYFYGLEKYKSTKNVFQEPWAVANFDDYWRMVIRELSRSR